MSNIKQFVQWVLIKLLVCINPRLGVYLSDSSFISSANKYVLSMDRVYIVSEIGILSTPFYISDYGFCINAKGEVSRYIRTNEFSFKILKPKEKLISDAYLYGKDESLEDQSVQACN